VQGQKRLLLPVVSKLIWNNHFDANDFSHTVLRAITYARPRLYQTSNTLENFNAYQHSSAQSLPFLTSHTL